MATDQAPGEDEATRPRMGSDGPDAGRGMAETSAASLSADDLFHVLQNSRRRAVIRYLHGHEGPVRMRDVAEQVTAWENDTTVAQITSTERQRVYISLYQSHLETLEEAGVIAYNKPRGVIEPQPVLDEVASYLDVNMAAPTDGAEAGDEEPRLGQYQVVAAGVALLVLGTALGLAGLGLLSWAVVGGGLLGLVLGMAVAKLSLDNSATG